MALFMTFLTDTSRCYQKMKMMALGIFAAANHGAAMSAERLASIFVTGYPARSGRDAGYSGRTQITHTGCHCRQPTDAHRRWSDGWRAYLHGIAPARDMLDRQ